jgi:hypothetical protein
MNEYFIGLALASITLGALNLILIAILCGKVFFSTHKVEFRTIEEHAKLRQELGLDEPEGDEYASAEVKARAMVEEVWGGRDDDFITDPLPPRDGFSDNDTGFTGPRFS